MHGIKNAHKNEVLFLGKKYQVESRLNQKNIIELSDKFYIASTRQSSIKNYLTSWYKQQARKIILHRLNLYAQRANQKYNTMSITDAQTRWGSCSSQKNLHFNWRLIMAPYPVIDYVIAHELAHLSEMNHSRSFWLLVGKIFPIYRQYRTWLKRNGDSLNL